MRILHVVSSLDPRGGGVAEAVRLLAGALVRAGHTTEVATLDAAGEEWLADLPFPVHALGPSRSSYQYAEGLIPFLRQQRARFDCLISHGLWQFHGLAAWWAWRGDRAKRFVFAHGMLDPWFKHAYPRKHLKKWLYWPWAEASVLRGARAVFFTCEEERRLARKSFWFYRAHEAIAPLGIADAPGDAAAQKEMFLTQYPVLRGKKLVLFLGRIAPKKGVDLLVEAFLRNAFRPDDCVLVMAGPEDEAQAEFVAALHARSDAKPVRWTGMLTGDLKWGALRAAEAFILPSHQENFGIAVVEALACGKPVLISDKVNIWREIDADHAGLVAPDTLAGTASLLDHWWALSPDEVRLMRERARSSYEQRFQIDRACAALVQQLRGFGVQG